MKPLHLFPLLCLFAATRMARAEGEIRVSLGDDALIAMGVTTINFGNLVSRISGNPLSFTIKNIGESELTGLSVRISGADPIDFSGIQPAVTSLAAGESTKFSVSFHPNTTGNRAAAIRIANGNNPNQPFTFFARGQGLSPLADISVEQPADTNLANNRSTRAFGASPVGKSGRILKFTIRNTGGGDLTGLKLGLTGRSPGDFVLTPPVDNKLAAGASITFKVQFKPTDKDLRKATLRIASNDTDENPFAIKLGGTGSVTDRVFDSMGSDLIPTRP